MKYLMRSLISVAVTIVMLGTPIFAYAEIKDAQENYLSAKKLFEEIDSLEWHYTNLPKYNEVIETAKKIIDENPDTDISIQSQYLIVQCYDKQAEYPKKSEAFNKYVSMVEKHYGMEKAAQAIKEMADEYFNLGGAQYWGAIKHYKLLLNKYPQSNLADYSQYRIGKSYEELWRDDVEIYKNPAQAIREYQKLLDIYPQSKWIDQGYEKLFTIYKDSRNYEKAIEAIQNYLRNYPKGSLVLSFQFRLALLYFGQEKRDKAISEFQGIIEKYPQSKESKMSKEYIEVIKKGHYLIGIEEELSF
jgi:tetratricopeptide (TPR) repeat protein